jgi:hypothetical protein
VWAGLCSVAKVRTVMVVDRQLADVTVIFLFCTLIYDHGRCTAVLMLMMNRVYTVQ